LARRPPSLPSHREEVSVLDILQVITQNLPSVDPVFILGFRILCGSVLAAVAGVFIICAGFALAQCCRGGQDEGLPGAVR
jgi:hypothetical protein